MKQGDLVGCSMRGGRYESDIWERCSVVRNTPPSLTIDEQFMRRKGWASSRQNSGEACGSRTIPDVHSGLVFEIRKLDGRLALLDSDGLIKSSGGMGVVGDVEKASISGEANAKADAMTVEGLRRRNVRRLVYYGTSVSWVVLSVIATVMYIAFRHLIASQLP